MHKLLQRQLAHLNCDGDTAPSAEQWKQFLERVSRVYCDADQDRYTNDRALELSSAEMKGLHHRLAQERDKLRTIFESAALGIVHVEENGTIVDLNPAAERMFGLERVRLLGTRLDVLLEEESPRSRAGWSLEPPRGEHRYVPPNRKPVWLHASKTWVYDGAGRARFGTIVLEDVTAKRVLEGELRHAQRLESVGRLAAGIAHEINTPIQFISDNVHFLHDSFEAVVTMIHHLQKEIPEERVGAREEAEEAADWTYIEDEVPKSIAQTLEGLQRVAAIVHSMKTFAHVGNEQAPADLNAALKSTVTVAGHELKGIAIPVLDLGEIPSVICCRGDLNQVFLNLLVNAAHAIADVQKPSEELGRITITTRVDGDWVVVSIADTGPGIPEDVATRMFDPFFTTKNVGRGSGQGLALAHAIVVEKHKGSISYETELGVGTTFHLRIPIAGAQNAARAA